MATPKLRKVYIVDDDDDVEKSINNKDEEKQITYTITRTYVAPDGTSKTKTIEYHGDEAKKVLIILLNCWVNCLFFFFCF
jgi:hypothetical protein